ncbi:MAG: hypothetical protein CO128_04535 [Ignavibacteriales bacterium CG_4_9_14_3_um_filter_30_11]|nr:MAG: hypothetical protein CO128_04535 [Ignavibacteriales bacterium CG_4_9_14_3_um_filter_30_11]
MIKKILLKSLALISICLLLFIGCEKDFNSVFSPHVNEIQISSVRTINLVVFNSSDPTIAFSIKFLSINGLEKVSINIYSPFNDKINDQSIYLLDNGNVTNNGDSVSGDLTYSNKYLLNNNLDNGTYNVEYKVLLSSGSEKIIASQNFTFDNGKSNLPSVISNLIQQDTVQRDVQFTFSVMVNDPDGFQDISNVYYELFMPNGTKVVNSQGISKFPMFDDGNLSSNGDVSAGDGRFTVFLTFPNTVLTGSWRFDFTAQDKAGHLSNVIAHNVEVK